MNWQTQQHSRRESSIEEGVSPQTKRRQKFDKTFIWQQNIQIGGKKYDTTAD